MTQAIGALLLSSGLLTAGFGQAVIAPEPAGREVSAVMAWITRDTLPDGRVAFLAQARPTSDDVAAAEFDYEFSVRINGRSAANAEVQAGSFTLAADATTAFAVTRLRLGPADSVSVRLLVVDADGSIAADVARVGEPARRRVATSPTVIEAPGPPTPRPLPRPSPAPELEIDGLIIDETRTKLGRDFYDLFYGKWAPPVDVSDYGITLTESPARGRTVRLTVEVDGEPVFRQMLQPRLDLLEASAARAASAVVRHLSRRSQISQHIRLEDQSASGI